MNKYITREITPEVMEAHKYFPVIMITGARQVGKSTLCRHLFPDYKFVNLENIKSRVMALDDPAGFIKQLGDKAIIDEVQNCPQLFSQIQYTADEEDKSKRFILTGSCNFSLMRTVCQSMAGRVAVFTLPPLTFGEVGTEKMRVSADDIIIRGFYPNVICDGMPHRLFYINYYNTYIERDVRDILKIGNLVKFDKFMRLMAGRAGTEYNAGSLSVEVGVSATTIREWISFLEASYIIFPLQPYHSNIKKRLTKMPKYYFYDTGLLCYLLNITAADQLAHYPLRGQIYENLVVAEMEKRSHNRLEGEQLYFYREYSGREIDVLDVTPTEIHAYEIKSAMTFRPEFMANIQEVRKHIKTEIKETLIYDGRSMPPRILNFRDI